MKHWKVTLTIEGIISSDEKPDCQELYEDLFDVANAMELQEFPGVWYQTGAEELTDQEALKDACEELGIDFEGLKED